MRKLLFILLSIAASAASFAASSMVGASDMREAKVWLKLDKPSTAGIKAFCTPKGDDSKIIDGYFSKAPEAKNANSSEVVFGPLNPGTEYKYTVQDGENIIAGGSFKTKPDYKDRTPPPDFTFALLGNNYVNDTEFDPPFRQPGGEYEIYETVRNTKPAFVIWADNAMTLRPADVGSRAGIFSRYGKARETLAAVPLLTTVPNYGVISRTSFGGEGSDSSISNKSDAIEAFQYSWANPTGPFEDINAYSFTFSDAEIFVLDDCSESSNLSYKSVRPVFIGERQMQWLMRALANSKAKFKIVVMNSSIINPVSQTPNNFAFAEAERKQLMDFLALNKIGGVVMLSANKPYGEITRHVRSNGYPILDVTAGPLTGRPATEIGEMNYFRMPSSAMLKRSFAQVKIDGAENARVITFTFFDSKGNAGFSTSLKESDLYKFE